MNFIAETVRAIRRLTILQALKEASGYALSEQLLGSVLKHVGQETHRDLVRTDLEWLEQSGLVRLEKHSVPSPLWVATLTHDGQEVASGVRSHHGVARPDAL